MNEAKASQGCKLSDDRGKVTVKDGDAVNNNYGTNHRK